MVFPSLVLGMPYDELSRQNLRSYIKLNASDVLNPGDMVGIDANLKAVPNPLNQKAEQWAIVNKLSGNGETTVICIPPGGTGAVTTNEAVGIGMELMLGTGVGNERKVKKLVYPGTWALDVLQLKVGEVVYVENKSGITKTTQPALCAVNDIIIVKTKGSIPLSI